MGLFAKAIKESEKQDENKTAPEYFMDMDRVEIKTVKDVITIDNIVVRVKHKIKKDDNGKPIKDANGKFVILTNFNNEPVFGAVAFVSFDDNKYFVTTSRPILNQLKIIDPEIKFKTVGEYTVNGVKGSKVKISSMPVPLADGKEYEYPVFIDVE